jgi:two-component system chemotaxis sensor kinase CheA
MDNDILQEFLAESRELLSQAQDQLLRLESTPDDPDVLSAIFRAFHTLKGGAGFLEAQHMVDWCHHLEDLFDKMRGGKLRVTTPMIDAILRATDVLSTMLDSMASGENPPPGPADLGRDIQDYARGDAPHAATAPTAAPAPAPAGPHPAPAPAGPHPAPSAAGLWVTQETRDGGSTGLYAERRAVVSETAPAGDSDTITQDEFERVLDSLYGSGQAPGLAAPVCAGAQTNDALAASPHRGGGTPLDGQRASAEATISQDEFERVLDQIHGAGQAPGMASSAAPAAAPKAEPAAPAPRSGNGAAAEEPFIRVDSNRLDQAMNQVGELVLLRNRLSAAVGRMAQEDETLARLARETDLAVNDLQSTVMRLRMQPCKRLFQSLPRVVRDASRSLGKKVRLDIEGEDVEIDKTVVDALSGPLIHLVRNALDHGIEEPNVRSKAGKPEEAVLHVAARHLGDKVQIQVGDDGRGMNAQKIMQHAISKGVITAQEAARLSEREMLDLIFLPGFSTKEQVSELSGRGVGMDVVRSTVASLRGRIDIDTAQGKGSTITLELPLTMAVLPVLYFRLRRETYALPVAAIENLLAIDPEHVHSISGRLMVQVDGNRVVPYIDLGQLLQDRPIDLHRDQSEGILIEQGLLVVSEAIGTEDSVVKPLDISTRGTLYQGATISGNGEVVLILDGAALARVQRKS